MNNAVVRLRTLSTAPLMVVAVSFLTLTAQMAEAKFLNKSAMCRDLFRAMPSRFGKLNTPPPEAPSIPMWNLNARLNLKALDKAIETITTSSEAKFESEFEKAGSLFLKLGPYANDRLDALISATYLHAPSQNDRWFVSEYGFALTQVSPNIDYISEQAFLRMRSERNRARASAYGLTIFAFGAGAKDAIVNAVVESLRRPHQISDQRIENLFLVGTNLLRSQMENEVRAMSARHDLSEGDREFSNHYWTHFFETGDLATIPKLDRKQTADLERAMSRAQLLAPMNSTARLSYLINLSYINRGRISENLKAELAAFVRHRLPAQPGRFEDATSADLWFADFLARNPSR